MLSIGCNLEYVCVKVFYINPKFIHNNFLILHIQNLILPNRTKECFTVGIFCMISLWRYMVAKLRKAAFGAHYILCICMCVRTCVVQSDERRSCFKVRFLVSIEQFFQVIYVVNISVDSLIHLYLLYQVKRGVNLCDRFIAINILFIDIQHLCVSQID